MVDNIAAIATPYGMGAISVIRCSGPDCFTLVSQVFKGKNLNNVASHTVHYGHIVSDGEEIDEVLCTVFRGPNSFDGEDIVEISCHGGIYVTNRVLQVLLDHGFRLAERGEFSKRAFLNHRLDLTEAESIMDIISAENDISLKSSLSSLRSSTRKLISSFREKILNILAEIEVNIDYPEYEDSVDVDHNYLEPLLKDMLSEMKKILNNSEISTIAIHGVNTAIVGKPNVGKSSILNMMLDENKAIVSDIPGTTRDLVEGRLTIRNVTLNLIDTAGIHETSDYVESIGIERSKEAISRADLVLMVIDASKQLDEVDKELLSLTEKKKRIIILNKNDLNSVVKIDGAISVSALKKNGMDLLSDKILEITSINSIKNMDGNYLNNNRQVNLMKKAYASLESAYQATLDLTDISLIEIDIKNAFDFLGEITGEAYPEELITALFTKFCLGK